MAVASFASQQRPVLCGYLPLVTIVYRTYCSGLVLVVGRLRVLSHRLDLGLAGDSEWGLGLAGTLKAEAGPRGRLPSSGASSVFLLSHPRHAGPRAATS